MATMKDIAKLAGVSHGTVSNVLNNKGNVSAEKIKAVKKAAQQLGYIPNVQAKELRKGSTRNIAVIVPSFDTERHYLMFRSIYDILSDNNYIVNVYFTHSSKVVEKSLVSEVLLNQPRFIILIDSKLLNDYSNTGIPLIAIDNAPSHKQKLFQLNYNYEQAAKDISKYIINKGFKEVSLLIEDIELYSNSYFITEFTEKLMHNGVNIEINNQLSNSDYSLAFNEFFSPKSYDCYVCLNNKLAIELLQVYEYNGRKISQPIITLSNNGLINDSRFINYQIEYENIGYEVLKLINEITPKDSLSSIKYLSCKGFKQLELKTYDEELLLKILLLKSPTSSSLKKIIPSFTKKTNISVEIYEEDYETLYNIVSGAEDNFNSFDIIRMDMSWLSDFAEDIYRPIKPELFSELNINTKMFSEYIFTGKDALSIPFEPSVQMLFYRKDFFNDPLLKRLFYERYKRELTVPENYKEYIETVEFFTFEYNKYSPTKYGTSLVFGTPIVAASDFLPWYLEENSSNSDKNFLIALDKYKNIHTYTDRQINLWWNDSVNKFSEGQTAMAIVYSNYASTLLENSESNLYGKIGFANIPGNNPLLGGGVIGINKNTKNNEAAYEFLKWLYNNETTRIATYLGGFINPESLKKDYKLTKKYPWLDAFEDSFLRGIRRNHNTYEDQTIFKKEIKIGKIVKSYMDDNISKDEIIRIIEQI